MTVLNPPVNGKSKDFSRPLHVFQVLFKANLIFKDFQDSLVYSSTFQACANLMKLPLLLFIFCSYIINTSLLFDCC